MYIYLVYGRLALCVHEPFNLYMFVDGCSFLTEAACSQRVTYEKDEIYFRHYSMLYYGFFADAHARHSTQFP